MVKSIYLIEGGHCGIQPSYAYICGDRVTIKNSKRKSLTVVMKTTNPSYYKCWDVPAVPSFEIKSY